MQEPTPINPSRLIAIGDIHGHAKALRRLLEQVQPNPADTIVTLGDCVNRGPYSRDVLDCLLELQHACRLISILGNHDEMMLDSRNDRFALERWATQAGEETLRSYGEPLAISNVPQAHWDLLSSFVSFHETDHFIFVHANYCWYTPMDQQPASLLRWLSLDESKPQPHRSEKIVILGHTPGPIRDFGHYRCIDTGCGFGGLLTAMEVHTGQCWQVTESGEAVADDSAEFSLGTVVPLEP
ncbi:MAG: metallophosphoesterase family protein [Planctomycetia bacterium]|nr:metallophosphoesterase family protein [Planctomycetia bacterium]